jgi:hypothetical protein
MRADGDRSQTEDHDLVTDPDMIPHPEIPGKCHIDARADHNTSSDRGTEKPQRKNFQAGRHRKPRGKEERANNPPQRLLKP